MSGQDALLLAHVLSGHDLELRPLAEVITSIPDVLVELEYSLPRVFFLLQNQIILGFQQQVSVPHRIVTVLRRLLGQRQLLVRVIVPQLDQVSV